MLPPAVDGDLCLADVPLLRAKHSRTAVAELCIRESCAAGAVILALLNLLRLTIRNRQSRWRDLLRESIPWFAVGLAVVVLCQTSFFIKGVRLNVDNITGLSAPDPIPGAGFLIFNIYFLAAIATLGFQLTRDLRMLAGSQRSEMAFIMIGAVVMLVSSVPLQLLLKLFVDTSKLLWLGPFRVVLFSLIIAYGISTRKIMDVGLFLRRAMSYAVLTAYLLALYGAVWWLVVLATTALFLFDRSHLCTYRRSTGCYLCHGAGARLLPIVGRSPFCRRPADRFSHHG